MTNPDERMRVLIVEDDPHIQALLSHFLRSAYDLEAAATVEEALRKAADRPFDLFLLDINLKEQRTGADLLDELRAMPAYRTTPAVACTAYALKGDRERFLDGGFDEHLSKPFTRQVLFETIRRALGAGRPSAPSGPGRTPVSIPV